MERVIEALALEEKLGQMFMSACENDYVSGNLINLITKYHIGGVYIAFPDFNKKVSLAHLNQYLQFYATNSRPLIIAAGQEFEKYDGIVVMPKEETLFKLNNRLYAKQLAEVIAFEHRIAGINTIFYPRLKVDDPEETETVAKHGAAIVQGLKKCFVASCVSGFPKAGELDQAMKPDNRKANVYPFYKAAQEQVGMLKVEELDESAIGYIRETLSFENIIIYEMDEPFTTPEEIGEHIIRAIHAGVNMIVLPYTYKEQLSLLNYVIEKAKAGKIEHYKINDSVKRLFALKKAYRMNELLTAEDLKLKAHYIETVKAKMIEKINALNGAE